MTFFATNGDQKTGLHGTDEPEKHTSHSENLLVHSIDPFGSSSSVFPSLIRALLATALFRCWHILIFFAAWATAVSVISNNVRSLAIQPTLLTVIGTVLGFVISYRTTASFERYNEGRRYWSQIILASRTLARAVWFHVPDLVPETPGDEGKGEAERRARVLIEKRTVINLIEAFSVAVKHYLRGEEGIHYVDLYHLIKYLPSYALPVGLANGHASKSNVSIAPAYNTEGELNQDANGGENRSAATGLAQHPPHAPIMKRSSSSATCLPFPATAKEHTKKTNFFAPLSPLSEKKQAFNLDQDDEPLTLLPARLPPKYHLFDLFPFSLLVKLLTKRGKELKGKKAARYRAKIQSETSATVTHNIPLEITLYMTSYLAALSARKSVDVPTMNLISGAISQLADALTGLERILTTPIPFSYHIHLWLVTTVYCLALPFQIWAPLKWLTIPATVIACFIFFGFLVAGEEIENPFGYDKNDLNMDHFTHNIIRNELLGIMARPPPNPADWAFSPHNDRLFPAHGGITLTPEQWVRRGPAQIQAALAAC